MKLSPNEIMAGLTEKNRLLSAKNDEYVGLAETAAQKECDYQIALSQRIIDLRVKDTPVTILKDIAKGGGVAQLKFEMDMAGAVAKACQNSMKICTSQIDTYRSLLSWLKAEMQSQ
jgi:hypothetical protein